MTPEYLSPTLRPFHRRNSRRRLELVIGHLAFEMSVVAPLDGFVHIPSAEQQHLYRQVDLGQARQPDALIHTCLLNDESSAGSRRSNNPPAILKLGESRFKAHYLLINRINPDNADNFRDQVLLAVTGR